MKYAFVDYRISTEEKNNLEALNCKIIYCEPCLDLYEAISGHPDILLHHINNKKIILHKGASISFEKELTALGFKIIRSKNPLKEFYPNDILLNAINTPTFFLHLLKSTDEALLNEVESKHIINVKQGYTKCSTAILSDKAFITSDKSIYKALTDQDADVLLLPAGDILLPGLDYGFIGGTCGMLDKSTILFYGNLNYYPHKDVVIAFLEKHNIKPIYLYDGPLIDRGSLIIINDNE